MTYGEIEDKLSEKSDRVNLNDYGMTKFIAERLIETSGVPYRILILPGAIGRDCLYNFIMQTAKKMLYGEPVFYYNKDAKFNNLVDVQDIAVYIDKIIHSKFTDTKRLFLGAKDTMTMSEMLEFLRFRLNSVSTLEEQCVKKKSFYIDCDEAVKDGYAPKTLESILDIVRREIIRREKGISY